MSQYQSKLEERIAKRLGRKAKYIGTNKAEGIKWTQPAKARKYTPDWIIRPGVFIEAKGKLDVATRQKHVWVRDQHPEITIYFIFERAYNKIAKNSNTTYADWASKNGFEWIDERDPLPKHWFETEESLAGSEGTA